MNQRTLALTLLALVLVGPVEDAAARKKGLDAPRAASGLKEALSLGTGRAVEVLGAVDGYLKNADVKIEAPKNLRVVEKALRAMGQDELVDEFVTSMNRAAEAAAPLAKEVFLDAIRDMTFDDALRIVKGTEHEATDYLEEKSRDHLAELFRPIVSEKLEEVGATAAFHRLVDRYATVPFSSRPVVDLDAHVTNGALDGLFYMIAKEEENIRTNVVARTTDLLKEVFGNQQTVEGKKEPWWKRL